MSHHHTFWLQYFKERQHDPFTLLRHTRSAIARFDAQFHALVSLNPELTEHAAQAQAQHNSSATRITTTIANANNVKTNVNSAGANVNSVSSANTNHKSILNQNSRYNYSSTNFWNGVPVLLKDNCLTENWPTFAGVAALGRYRARSSASIVRKLRESHAVIVGKTNVPPLCMDVQCANREFGTTSNPFDATRTSGGSSGGSAVAVALGYVPVALGSDLAGSLRIPSAFCGVCSLRPSAGRILADAHIPPSPADEEEQDLEKKALFQCDMCVIGPIAIRVELLEQFMAHFSSKFSQQVWPSSVPVRVAITPCFPSIPTDARIIQAMKELGTTLQLGGHVECEFVVPPLDLDELREAYLELCKPFALAEAAMNNSPLTPFLPNEKRLKQARAVIQEAHQLLQEHIFSKFDVWIMPTTPVPPFPHNPKHTPLQFLNEHGNTECMSYWKVISYCTPISTLGNPVVTLPMGMIEHLPFGVQVIGQLDQDEKLLAACRVLEPLGLAKMRWPSPTMIESKL